MKIAVLLTARLGSTRLPRKHLLVVQGRPILQFLVDSVLRTFAREIEAGSVAVAIATGGEEENRALRDEIRGCEVFHGADRNIPLRHLQAARYLGADAILAVDGDDLVCAPSAMRRVFEALAGGALLVGTEGLPLGMNASGYARATLERVGARFGELAQLETGWGHVFEGVEAETIRLGGQPRPDLRFTLDYEQDFRFFSALLADPDIAEGRIEGEEIVQRVDARQLGAITAPVVERYWQNFHAHMRQERARATR